MSNNRDLLGDRMKGYESEADLILDPKLPVIIRVDGKAFHTFTKFMERPWDDRLIACMQHAGMYLAKNLDMARLVYGQSDEISIMILPPDPEKSQPLFGNKIRKLVSLSASMATIGFARAYVQIFKSANFPAFDSRAFSIPHDEVCNYFIWRQKDATRNSIQMMARSMFSHKQCEGKSCDDLINMMILEHGKVWDIEPAHKRHGWTIRKVEKLVDPKDMTNIPEQYRPSEPVKRRVWELDLETPSFVEDRNYVDILAGV